jgi:hypothetical protein
MTLTPSDPPVDGGTTSTIRYRKKPVEIEALQWDGTADRSMDIRSWVEREHQAGAVIDTDHIQHLWDYDAGCYIMPRGQMIFAPHGVRCLIVVTLEGEMVARPGWWIIRGVKGEFYPCDPEIFAETYDAVRPATTSTSSFALSRHPYAENSYFLDHFTGHMLVSREDLEEAYRQLDDYLYPNPGFEPRIAEGSL